MKPARTPVLLVLIACGSDAATGATALPTPSLDGGTLDATTGASVDAGDPYLDAVLSATWVKLKKAPTAPGGAKMDDIFFVSPSVGFLANGPDSSLWRTEDSGETWKKVFEHMGTYFRALAFVDTKHGFAGNLGAGLTPSISDENVLYETKDGGDSWSAVTAITGPKPSGVCNLAVVDAEHLVAVGRTNGPSNLLTSSNAGASWTSIDVSSKLSMLIDAHFSSPTEGVLVGMGAGADVCTVVRTVDGGQTFEKVFASKIADSLCWKVHFPSTAVGYVAVQEKGAGPAVLAKTADGGKTWTETTMPIAGNAKGAYSAIGVGFLTDTIGWIASEDAKLPTYRTQDGGETWQEVPSLKAPINRFRFVDKNTAYAVGGAAWKLTIPASGS